MTGKHKTAAARRETDESAREEQDQAAIDGLVGSASQDVLEVMMAAQIVAVHGAAMDCYRSAPEVSERRVQCDELVFADKFARTFAVLVAAQRRYRRKPRRTITVEYARVEPNAGALPKGNVRGGN